MNIISIQVRPCVAVKLNKVIYFYVVLIVKLIWVFGRACSGSGTSLYNPNFPQSVLTEIMTLTMETRISYYYHKFPRNEIYFCSQTINQLFNIVFSHFIIWCMISTLLRSRWPFFNWSYHITGYLKIQSSKDQVKGTCY